MGVGVGGEEVGVVGVEGVEVGVEEGKEVEGKEVEGKEVEGKEVEGEEVEVEGEEVEVEGKEVGVGVDVEGEKVGVKGKEVGMGGGRKCGGVAWKVWKRVADLTKLFSLFVMHHPVYSKSCTPISASGHESRFACDFLKNTYPNFLKSVTNFVEKPERW